MIRVGSLHIDRRCIDGYGPGLTRGSGDGVFLNGPAFAAQPFIPLTAPQMKICTGDITAWDNRVLAAQTANTATAAPPGTKAVKAKKRTTAGGQAHRAGAGGGSGGGTGNSS